MVEVKVKTESLPARCEVCHQSDLFNPQTNYCVRCRDTAALILNSFRAIRDTKNKPPEVMRKQLDQDLVTSAVCSTILVFFFTWMAFSGNFHFSKLVNIACWGSFSLSYWRKVYEFKKREQHADIPSYLPIIQAGMNLFASLSLMLAAIEKFYPLITGKFSVYSMIVSIIFSFGAYLFFRDYQQARQLLNRADS